MILKINHNKRNNQLGISIPRRALKIGKKKVPKYLDLKDYRFIE